MFQKTIMAAVLVAVATAPMFAQNAHELKSRTRFGRLELDDQNMLTFNGHRLDPPIQPGFGMDLSEPYRFGATDVVLVTKIGGTACPVLYYFVSVTESGAHATRPVGTCNQATSIERRGDSIALTMHGFLGPFEPEEQRRKAFQDAHVLIFRNGAITDNGKRVR